MDKTILVTYNAVEVLNSHMGVFSHRPSSIKMIDVDERPQINECPDLVPEQNEIRAQLRQEHV